MSDLMLIPESEMTIKTSSELEVLTSKELDEQIVRHIDHVEQCETIADRAQRRTVYESWEAGRRLRIRKERMDHGEWYPYLALLNIEPRTALRHMNIGQIGQMSDLPQTADEAEKIGKSLVSQPSKIKDKLKKTLSPLDKALMRAHDAEEELEELRIEREKLAITAKALETEVFNEGEASRVKSEVAGAIDGRRQAERNLRDANESIKDLNRTIRILRAHVADLHKYIEHHGLKWHKDWETETE